VLFLITSLATLEFPKVSVLAIVLSDAQAKHRPSQDAVCIFAAPDCLGSWSNHDLFIASMTFDPKTQCKQVKN
jgi:hypothetical protein